MRTAEKPFGKKVVRKQHVCNMQNIPVDLQCTESAQLSLLLFRDRTNG